MTGISSGRRSYEVCTQIRQLDPQVRRVRRGVGARRRDHERRLGLATLRDLDDLAGAEPVGGLVDLAAVDADMTVGDGLARLIDRFSVS
ncbi:hypothetical protein GCM10029978_075720 [Actinoallomurus acanthiterrae]